LHITTPSSGSGYAQSAKTVMSADSDFVLATSGNAISSLLDMAADYPERNIIAIGSAQNSGLAMEIDFKTEDSGYLAGVAAAASSASGKIAYIGGLAKDDMQSLVGFYTGAKSYNPNIIIYYDYVGSYNDYATAYSLAYQFCSNGADIIFSNCGGSGLGVYDAAAAFSARLIVTDMYDFPNDDMIIAKTVKSYENAASYAIELFMNGEYTKSVVRIGLVIGAIDIEYSDTLSDEVKDVVDQYKDMIKQNNIVIPSTWGEYNTYF
jgi:basic membrane protein A